VKFLHSLIPLLVQEVRFADSDGVRRSPEIGGVRGWSNKHSAGSPISERVVGVVRDYRLIMVSESPPLAQNFGLPLRIRR